MKYKLAILLLFSVLIPLSAQAKQHKKVILVLGSGGNKGLAHVGVIEELERMGIVPDIIVGCSAGAIVGALYAQHRDIAAVKNILINLKANDLIDFTVFQKYSISTREKIEKFLDKNLKVKDFGSLATQFIAVVTDLQKGEPVYFNEGKLHPSVLASAALPGLFPPYQIGENIYVDGGVCDPLPICHARSLEKNCVVIASDISPAIDGFEIDNIVQILRKSLEVMYQRLAYCEHKDADIVLEMNFSSDLSSVIEDRFNQEIYERGIEAVRSQSKQILKVTSQK